MSTEHRDIAKVHAFREMCEAAVKVYDGTEEQYVADWAREAPQLLDEHDMKRLRNGKPLAGNTPSVILPAPRRRTA